MASSTLDRFAPKAADHPSVGEACPACGKPFKEGEYTTLIAVAPASKEDARKAAAGGAYTAEAVEIHYACGEVVFRMVRQQ